MSNYVGVDLNVVVIANLINVVMALLFAARISGLPEIQYVLGIVAMFMGFTLGYAAFLNRRNRRNKWFTALLLPVLLFFIVDLFLDYIFVLDFRRTIFAVPFVLLYYVGLWGLIGYSFTFSKKWGIVTLATYFVNMTMSILPYV